jgi:hypothetical protein
MNEHERAALLALGSFDWAPTSHDVWAPLKTHVSALNDEVAGAIMSAFAEATESFGRSPLGLTVLGESGAGKTHMLRWVRDRVQASGGYFFLVELKQGRLFWENVVHTMLVDLRRPGPDGDDQLANLLRGLCGLLDLGEDVREALLGERPLAQQELNGFTESLWRADRRLAQECRYTARSLAMLNATDPLARDIGESYLTSQEESEAGEWKAWGLRGPVRSAHEIVGQLSQLLALTGPALIALDQLETLISNYAGSSEYSTASESTRSATDQDSVKQVPIPEVDLLIEQIGAGLTGMRETTRRTLTVVTCFYATWQRIRQRAVASVDDRFRQRRLTQVPSPDVGRELVEAHFQPRFAEARVTPAYPTWPILPEAFADAPRFTARALLRRVDAHVQSCLRAGVIRQLARLEDSASDVPPPAQADEIARDSELVALDEMFDSLRNTADTTDAMASKTEDTGMPPLLFAGLEAWRMEQGPDGERYSLESAPGRSPAWHARVIRELDGALDERFEWAFRSIAGPQATAVGNRIERIKMVTGLDPSVPRSRVFVLRTGDWGAGPKTRDKIRQFEDAGGVILQARQEDLSAFWALRVMLQQAAGPALSAWLRLRRPASQTALLTTIFGPPGSEAAGTWGDGAGPRPNGDQEGPRPVRDPYIPSEERAASPRLPPAETGVGGSIAPSMQTDVEAGTVIGSRTGLLLASLRKHVVIFAGSGSGKTVLLRRLVEECALQGVSSIVLDPNNDLARLGDPWPQPPAGWGNGDATRAAQYFASTDVVIWTPRREAGRPLSFQPLPDFTAVFEDPDEFQLALDIAVAALAPRARMTGATAKAERGRAVLREALAYFARRGSSGLSAFVDLLAELPDDVTSLSKAPTIAEDMAQTLTAAMINDPMFGGAGTSLDPGELLTPPPGRRARVSVISLVGLPGNEQRQSFVNQLQMALFAWIKRHPAGNRPLGGLFVMDEAQTLAPSGAMTACTESTLALASQARKYGLGLIFATQAPRGIHNRIVGNAATQFYGFLNSPVQVAAAKEMAAAKASGVVDISRLNAGQFYMTGEGLPFQKAVMPMCLSYHPASALTAEEVLARSRLGG